MGTESSYPPPVFPVFDGLSIIGTLRAIAIPF